MKLVALVAPNLTAVAPVKLVPLIATTVPPVVGPEFGLTRVTVGAATNDVSPTAMFAVPLPMTPDADVLVLVRVPVVGVDHVPLRSRCTRKRDGSAPPWMSAATKLNVALNVPGVPPLSATVQ